MTTAHAYSEVVEAEGHLIDSQILNAVFDTVVKSNATFDVLKFDIGRSNDAPSFISMRISAPTAFHDVSGDFVAPHYVRFTVNDKPGILAQVTTAYARYGINIEGVLQLPKFRKDRLPFVTTLEECSESVLDRALAEVAKSDFHVQPPLSLPIFA